MKTIILIAIIAACTAEYYTPCSYSLCNNKPDGALFALDEHRPDVFVQCSNGAPICQRCPPHTEFNNKFSVCVRRTVPVCKGHGCKPHKPHRPHPEQCPKSLCADYPHSDYVVFRYPHKPTYYVQCVAGSPFCRKCPHGLIFDNKVKVCVFPTVQKPHVPHKPAKKH
ncbi:uncharacterized protein [Clytia hemisphaerica]|uniref:Chitin-binding type-2 domain-containing protein n=1 Tax=Clytia hemisphaerica TaxID=252671 RepID=A0A7M6DNR2_9CNID